MRQRHAGFTIFEMVVVLIVMGIITAGIAPLLSRQHGNAMEERDRLALEDAKTAIINYAISYGGIPDSLPIDTTTGALPTTFLYPATLALSQPLGLMPPSSNPTAADFYAVPPFGVNNWGVFGGNSSSLYAFRLDVNDHLKSSYINWINSGSALTYDAYLTLPANQANTAAGAAVHQGGNRVVFCQSVNEQMAAVAAVPPTTPSICQNYNPRTVAAVTTVCAVTSPVAFALFSVGNNRVADQENDDRAGSPATTALKGNRIYENDSRGINSSPGDDQYDDQVKSYSLPALARDCREKMGVAAEVMNCSPGSKFVNSVTNTSVSAVAYSVGACVNASGASITVSGSIPGNFTQYISACCPRSNTLTVGAFTSQVSGVNVDTNADGRVDCVSDGTTLGTSCQ